MRIVHQSEPTRNPMRRSSRRDNQDFVIQHGNGRGYLSGSDDNRDNNDKQEDNDTRNQAGAHLHVLPPHLLADSVGAPAEALRRGGEVVRLVLEGVEALATLGDLVDVIAHHADGVVDLCLERLRPRVAASALLGSGLAAGDVGVVRGILIRHVWGCGCAVGFGSVFWSWLIAGNDGKRWRQVVVRW
jgi:hypothetical protein